MIAVLVVFVVAGLILAPAVLFGGWITMLCLGALASIFDAPNLAIGYWSSVLVSLILWLLVGHAGAK